MDRSLALDQLAACLKGEPPAGCDWAGVVALANQSLTTPQLTAALESLEDRLPLDLAPFLAEVRRRNRERNRRLAAQLQDAVAGLNRAGVEPVLLKGAALLAGRGGVEMPDRLLSDLDLLVAPEEVETAIGALRAAGFGLVKRFTGSHIHVAAEFGRPQDVGVLDLHQHAPGPAGLAEKLHLEARYRTVDVGGGQARVPDEAAQILYLVLHDQLHDGDYWRGGFDLRHLADLARLAPALSPEDWTWLDQACATDLVRAALEAQLFAAERLLGAAGGLGAPGRRARLTYRRWRLQYAQPGLRIPLAAVAAAGEWGSLVRHNLADAHNRSSASRRPASVSFNPLNRYRRLRAIFQVKTGKI